MKTKLWIISITSIFAILISGFIIKSNQVQALENKEEVAIVTEPIVIDPIVYDGMTLTELGAKLDKSLNSSLSGYGYLYASYSLEVGVDPYLAVAISLHETGCSGECSNLVKKCNNVGGQKGKPSCNGGSYKKYNTLEEGIKGFIDNLYKGYISKGLVTPEQIGPRYAASTTWATKVNSFIAKIEAK